MHEKLIIIKKLNGNGILLLYNIYIKKDKKNKYIQTDYNILYEYVHTKIRLIAFLKTAFNPKPEFLWYRGF